MLKGIDVASHQGVIDWVKVKESGVSFAMLRAATGSKSSPYSGRIVKDSLFEKNLVEANKAGVKVGAYFYSYAMSLPAGQTEMENFLAYLRPYNNQLVWPVAFDLEDPTQTVLSKEVKTGLARQAIYIIRQAGYVPMLYCNPNWVNYHYNFNEIDAVGDMDVWIAHHGVSKPRFSGKYTIWQYLVGEAGAVPGIKTKIDLNYGYKDYSVKVEEPAYMASIDALAAAGKINSPDYWKNVCAGKEAVLKENIAALLNKWAADTQ